MLFHYFSKEDQHELKEVEPIFFFHKDRINVHQNKYKGSLWALER